MVRRFRAVRVLAAFVLLVLASGACTGTAAAQSGQLDTSIGAGGVMRNVEMRADAVSTTAGAVGPGGVVYVASTWVRNEDQYFSRYNGGLVKYTAAGVLDTTFGGGDGIVTSIPGVDNTYSMISHVRVDSVGRVLLYNDYLNRVTRYLADGTLDTSFGTGGSTTVPSGQQPGAYGEMEVDGLDRPVISLGNFSSNATTEVARLTSSGVPDPSFGTAGLATLALPATGASWGPLVIDAANRPTLAGRRYGGGTPAYLARLTTSGIADPTFNGDGNADGVVATTNAIINLAIQSSGRIITVNESGTSTARYMQDGSLDPTYGTAGVANIAADPATDLYGGEAHVAVDPADRILVSQAVYYDRGGAGMSARIIRQTANGAADPTFDGDGATGPLAPGSSFAGGVSPWIHRMNYSLDVDSSSRPVIIATSSMIQGSQSRAVRLTTAGAPDGTFGTAGSAGTTIEPLAATPSDGGGASLVTASRFYLLEGYVGLGGVTQLRINAFSRATGLLDPTFGTGGGLDVRLDWATSSYVNQRGVGAMVEEPGGGLTVAFTQSGPFRSGRQRSHNLLRVTPAGAVDTSFGGGDGIIEVVGPGNFERINSMHRLSDGSYVLAGSSSYDTTRVFKVTSAGAYDASWGVSGGYTEVDTSSYRSSGAVLDATGRIIIVTGDSDGVTVVRLLANGQFDPSFGGGTGRVTHDIGGGNQSYGSDAVVLPDGRIGVSFSPNGTAVGVGMVMLNDDGSIDTSFGASGWATSGVSGSYSVPVRLASGELVLVGGSEDRVTSVGFTPTGQLNLDWGGTGSATAWMSQNAYDINHVALRQATLLADGRIHVGGGVSNWSGGFADQTSAVILPMSPPAVPVRVAPADGGTAPPAAVLQVTHSDPDVSPGTIDIEICSDAACASVVRTGTLLAVPSGTNGTYTASPSLPNNTTFWWRARATDPGGRLSGWSSIWSFTTTTAPVIVDNQSGDTTWRSANAGTYDVDVTSGTNITGFETRAWTGTGQTGTMLDDWRSISPAPSGSSLNYVANWAVDANAWLQLQEGQNEISVRATNADGSSIATDVFFIRKDTVRPTASSPPDDGLSGDIDAVNTVSQLSLSWAPFVELTSGINRYQYCFTTSSTGADCAGGAVRTWSSVALATSWTNSSLPVLSDGTVYFSCVRARDQTLLYGAGSCSDGVQVDRTGPAVPVLVSPADGSSIASWSPLVATYDDVGVPTPGHVEYQVCSDIACAAIAESGSSAPSLADGVDGSWTPTVAAGSWYWRARNVDGAGNASAWSAVRTVTIQSVSLTMAITSGPAEHLGSTLLADVTGTSMIEITTNAANGFGLHVDDGSSTIGMARSPHTDDIADWTGTEATPSLWTPGVSGAGGYFGITVTSADGGRLPKWGAGSSLPGDLASNRYMGMSDVPRLLHSDTTNNPAPRNVEVSYRAMPAPTTTPGSYSALVSFTAVANP